MAPGEQPAIHRAVGACCANGSTAMSKRKHAIEAYFQSGLRLHRAGRLQEAEQTYRQVLAAAPGHADSLHMLGVLATQCGQPQAALSCIDQAIAIKPSVGDVPCQPRRRPAGFAPAGCGAGGLPARRCG